MEIEQICTTSIILVDNSYNKNLRSISNNNFSLFSCIVFIKFNL